MTHAAEQFSLDLAGANPETVIQAQWAENMRKDAHNWTTEAMAMHWSGVHHWDLWNAQPKYQRDQIVRFYEEEQDALLFAQERWDRWDYLCEVFCPGGKIVKAPPFPDGTEVDWPRRPHMIRPFSVVWREFTTIDWKKIEDRQRLAKEIADRIHADWSAGRPCQEKVFDPYLAHEISLIIGRPFEQSMPEDRSVIPLDWQWLYLTQQARRK